MTVHVYKIDVSGSEYDNRVPDSCIVIYYHSIVDDVDIQNYLVTIKKPIDIRHIIHELDIDCIKYINNLMLAYCYGFGETDYHRVTINPGMLFIAAHKLNLLLTST